MGAENFPGTPFINCRFVTSKQKQGSCSNIINYWDVRPYIMRDKQELPETPPAPYLQGQGKPGLRKW
jgi:hypothetical protein